MNITGKQILYACGIALFVLSVAASLLINNSLPLLAITLPLIVLDRSYVVPLLLIIPAIEGALTVGDTPPITESLAIVALLPLFMYDILRRPKQPIPFKLSLLYIVFAFFIVIGFIVYNQHPEIFANARKGVTTVYIKMGMKIVKVIFFFVYLKFLVNRGKEYVVNALNLLKNIVPYLMLIIAVYVIFRGHAGNKFGSLHFGDAHHGDFTANVAALGIYLYIGFFSKKASWINKGIMGIGLLAMVFIIMQMASRNGLLCFGLISVISMYLIFNRKSLAYKTIAVTLGIFVLAAGVYLLRDSPTIQRFIYQTEVEGGGDRVYYWASGVEAIREEPFLGFGGDESSSLYAVSKYAPEVEDHIMHNTFLECAVEYGIFGLIFYLIFVTTIVRWSYKNFRKAMADDNFIIAAPGVSYCISIFAGLFISRLWESTLWYNMSLVFAVGILWVYPVIKAATLRRPNPSSIPLTPATFDKKALT